VRRRKKEEEEEEERLRWANEKLVRTYIEEQKGDSINWIGFVHAVDFWEE